MARLVKQQFWNITLSDLTRKADRGGGVMAIQLSIGIAGCVLSAFLYVWAIRIRWRDWDAWATSMVVSNIAFILGMTGLINLLVWWVTK